MMNLDFHTLREQNLARKSKRLQSFRGFAVGPVAIKSRFSIGPCQALASCQNAATARILETSSLTLNSLHASFFDARETIMRRHFLAVASGAALLWLAERRERHQVSSL